MYCSQLQSYRVLDYDDILLEVLHRLTAGDEGETGLENPFSYLLVDEFQDINEIQYRLIKEWGKRSKSVFIIGDPDQAIYGFRGSDFRYFARFIEDYPGVQQIRLTSNYRSTPEIIASAAAVISSQKTGGRAFSLEAKRESGARVCLLETGSDFSEALFVAKEINRLVGGIDMLDTQAATAPERKGPAAEQQRGFSDIAVLYRTNRQAEILEQCFLKEGIQYVVAGRDEFLADKPVVETLAFFRFLLNPGDIASLLVCLKAESTCPANLRQKVLESYLGAEKSISSLAKIWEGAQMSPSQTDRPWNFIAKLRKYAALINKEKPWKIIETWINEHNLPD